MEKISKGLGYLPELAFIAITIRICVLSAGIGDALALAAIVGFMGVKIFLSKESLDDRAELDKKINDIASQVQSLSMDRALRRQANEPKVTQAGRKLF